MDRAQLFWQTYLNLEKELLDIAKYVYITDEKVTYSGDALVAAPCKTQLETFSPHIADLLLKVCVEIEAIAKELYYKLGGEKSRGNSGLFFDEVCLKLIDIKCKTHNKVVMISCPLFDLKRAENLSFKPLKEAHKRQGTDWERAYQALKHDRYSSLSQGTIKNLLHAIGALFLLNIYFRDVRMTSRYLEVNNLDFSLGSSIFSVKRPNSNYVISIVNNTDIKDFLSADDSPFVLKYTDAYYKEVLDINRKMLEEMRVFLLAQPELNESEFKQQLKQAQAREEKDPRNKLIMFWELAKYRLQKRIPASLPFEERKKLFISSPEWNGRIRLHNPHLEADDITEENIQAEMEHAGVLAGMEMQQRFENLKMQKAFSEGYCELVLDMGNVRYHK